MRLTNCAKLSLLLAFLYSDLYSQGNNTDIGKIRKVFNEINSNRHLNKIELDAYEFLEGTPDGGASLTGYFDNTRLVKIRSWIGLSYGIRQIDYYFHRDSLTFVFVTERNFKIIRDSLDYEHTTLALEGRYYFNHDKLIHRKVKGKGFWDKEQESNLLPDSKSYFELLKKKRNNDLQSLIQKPLYLRHDAFPACP